MKFMIAAFVMYVVVGLGITSQQNPASSIEVGANTSTLLAAEDTASDVVPMGGCTGLPPCCDFNDDGTCNLHMICFGGIWACP